MDAPPITPIDIDGGGGDGPIGRCPACNRIKASICDCGYDWEKWEWLHGCSYPSTSAIQKIRPEMQVRNTHEILFVAAHKRGGIPKFIGRIFP
jgi:hypothetical protein